MDNEDCLSAMNSALRAYNAARTSQDKDEALATLFEQERQLTARRTSYCLTGGVYVLLNEGPSDDHYQVLHGDLVIYSGYDKDAATKITRDVIDSGSRLQLVRYKNGYESFSSRPV